MAPDGNSAAGIAPVSGWQRAGRGFCASLLLVLAALTPSPARGADALVESAVTALAQLTDPARLGNLPDDSAVQAQLGPALGWLHVARRHDVSPEAVIARALRTNGLSGEQAAATRESLLRNLARADAWELFTHPESARALANGQPPTIPAGMHRGRVARVTFAVVVGGVLEEAPRPAAGGGWDFGCLTLRADDEPPPRPLPGRRRSRHRGDLLADEAARPARPRPVSAVRKKEAPRVPLPPIEYDDQLPAQ